MEKDPLGLFRALQIPRYTSYPTSPHFNSNVDGQVAEQWYSSLGEGVKNLSLYLHVPFCQKLCFFCACHMKVINSYAPVTQYLSNMKKEMAIAKKALKRDLPVTNIHFGGGSPTIISAKDFILLVDKIRENFSIDNKAKMAIEVDPRNLNNEKIIAYGKVGMNRISLGVQDFDEKTQKSINRQQSFSLVKNTMNAFLENGMSSINMDIMYGLPLQKLDSLKRTLEKVLILSPERLAVFGYAHVPWVKKHQKLLPQNTLPNLDLRFKMYAFIKDTICKNGYRAIGMDHFAKDTDPMVQALDKGTLRRNFQGYTTDTADALIGIGHSSIGSVPQGYIQNTTEPAFYARAVEGGKLPVKRGLKLTQEDRARASIIEHIMCYMRADINKILNHMNVRLPLEKEMRQIRALEQQRLLSLKDNVITILERGRVAIRIVASVFDTYLDTNQVKHSTAV